MTAYNKLFDSKCAFPDKDFANDYSNVQTAFKNGAGRDDRERPVVDGRRPLRARRSRSTSNLGVAPLPKGPGGQGSPVGGHSFVIAKKSKNVAAAYKFIQWLTSRRAGAASPRRTTCCRPASSAYKDAAVKNEPIISPSCSR